MSNPDMATPAPTPLEILHPPHRKPSRPVEKADRDRVKLDMIEMAALCNQPLGKHSGAKALAHCQVEAKDPLRFFVLKNGDAIVNPKIINATGSVRSREGCMSYPFRDPKLVKRHDHITVRFDLIKADGEEQNDQETIFRSYNGDLCLVYQHEIDHFWGKTVYDVVIS
jgi:peptide deformylase